MAAKLVPSVGRPARRSDASADCNRDWRSCGHPSDAQRCLDV